MDYYEDLNMLIIYGGRNDGRTDKKNSGAILNDICMLNLENFNWVTVDVNGLTDLYKCAHCSILLNTQIIIFGGM